MPGGLDAVSASVSDLQEQSAAAVMGKFWVLFGFGKGGLDAGAGGGALPTWLDGKRVLRLLVLYPDIEI